MKGALSVHLMELGVGDGDVWGKNPHGFMGPGVAWQGVRRHILASIEISVPVALVSS